MPTRSTPLYLGRDGARQARLARFLKGCQIEPIDDELAREAGVLLGRTGTIDGVDAAVVLSAQRRGGVVCLYVRPG